LVSSSAQLSNGGGTAFTSVNNVTFGSITSSLALVGSNTSDSFGLADSFQILSSGATAGVIARYSNNANGARWALAKSRATAVGGRATVQNGDNLGRVSWYADNGVTFDEAATMFSEVDGGPTAGRIVFQPGSGLGLVTKAVIDQNGMQVTGSLNVSTNITASALLGTASYAITASYAVFAANGGGGGSSGTSGTSGTSGAGGGGSINLGVIIAYQSRLL